MTPGFVVGVIDEALEHYLSFGTRGPRSSDTLNAGDVFELGSLTKPMVATLMAVLDKENEIDLRRPVNAYLPQHARNHALKDLSVLEVLTHFSGLPKYPARFGDYQKDPDDPYGSMTRKQLMQFYRTFDPGLSSGFIYSHVNYALVEVLLEHHLSRTLEELLEEHLFNPLEMTASGINDHDPLAEGFDFSTRMAKPWSFAAFAGSEGIRSSLYDVMRFLRYSLEEAPESVVTAYGTTGYEEGIDMALGWYIVDYRSIRVFAHSGHTSGHYAFAAFSRDTQTAVAILANSAVGVEDLGFLIMRLINYNWKRKS